MRSAFLRAGPPVLAALALSGCIDSATPIFTDSQPMLGPHLKLQLFSLRKGFAYEPEHTTFAWNGSHYAHETGGLEDVGAFSVHPFEAGDDIIQTAPAERGQAIEYALLHKLAEGVFLVMPIDEADAGEKTRGAYCKPTGNSGCRIETREQLIAFARATQAQRKDNGGLAIRLRDAPEK